MAGARMAFSHEITRLPDGGVIRSPCHRFRHCVGRSAPRNGSRPGAVAQRPARPTVSRESAGSNPVGFVLALVAHRLVPSVVRDRSGWLKPSAVRVDLRPLRGLALLAGLRPAPALTGRTDRFPPEPSCRRGGMHTRDAQNVVGHVPVRVRIPPAVLSRQGSSAAEQRLHKPRDAGSSPAPAIAGSAGNRERGTGSAVIPSEARDPCKEC